jgi:hypothetical protein
MAMRPVLLCLLSLALAPAAARAAVITARADCDRYNGCSYQAVVRAQPSEANDLTVRVLHGQPVFSDPGVVMQAGDNCISEGDHVVSCLADVTSVRVLAGDRDDVIDASGYRYPVTIDGGPGNDILSGGPSRDELRGGQGVDEVHGGPGPDEISFADATTPVRVDLRSQTATVAGHLERFDGIESAVGGSGDDVLIGNAHSNGLAGGLGDDQLFGRAGDDTLTAGRGTDVLRGGRGDDSITDTYPARRGADADDVGCGRGHDIVGNADAPSIIHDDCERLAADNFTWPVQLWHHGRLLRIRRDMLGNHLRLTVKVLSGGRLQRVYRRLAASHGTLPAGVFSFSLSTPAIELARAAGPARVTVRILASSPRGEFPVTLHLLLAPA